MKSFFFGRYSILNILITAMLFSSCHKVTPAGFWVNHREEYLIESENDQGPWGGHRALYWRADFKYTFRPAEVIDFATENGWQITDSIFFSANDLIKWDFNGPTFPFTYADFSEEDMQASTFPRWITSDVRLYRFKTGWIAVEPGNARDTENNGYIVIGADGKEMSVYHLWGE